jgi:hypothetical protein
MQFSIFFASAMAIAALFQGAVAAPAAEAAPAGIALRVNKFSFFYQNLINIINILTFHFLQQFYTHKNLNCAKVNLPARMTIAICGCDNPLCPPCPACP